MAAPTPELPRTSRGESIPIPNSQERGNLIGLAWVRCLLLVQSSVARGGDWAFGYKMALECCSPGSSICGGRAPRGGEITRLRLSQKMFPAVRPYGICKIRYLKLGCPRDYDVDSFFRQ